MQILTFGNEMLREKAAPAVNLESGPSTPPWDTLSWAETAQKMFDALSEEKGIGLAGPQIGLPERVFITNVENDVPRVFINPSIIETSEKTAKCEEGCLSVPGAWAVVERPETVKVQAWNEKGRPFTIEAGGIVARVIQHEYDHLEGVLFIDRISEIKRKKILDKIAKKAGKHER